MVTFRVSDVECERTRLPANTTASQLAKLGWRPEAHRIAATELVGASSIHPLALAVHIAFARHRPLVLTPDAVWLCIAQSLATHIELHAEALRSRLVRHAGKLALEARRDGFVPGDPANDWPGVVDELVAQIRGHIGGRADMFVADFSTTGPLDRTASQIALMGAMREYFSYAIMTMCGIPEITLTGTPEDWASMRRRADAFRELDLAWWVEALDPVLAKLEATARGQVDREFWRRLYKLESMSGGDRAFGWLNTLFAVVETLASLRREASDERTELSLPRTPRLRSLDGIEHLRGLVTLSIAHAPLLETIAPLAGMTSLVHLDLGGCPRLSNVGPVLETLPQLEMLSLARMPALRLADVLPIARMNCLNHVALMDCTGLPEHIRYLYRSDTVVDLQAELAELAGRG